MTTHDPHRQHGGRRRRGRPGAYKGHTAHPRPRHEFAASPLVPETTPTEPLAFDALGFGPALMAGIHDRGFTQTTPVQTAVLPVIRTGRDMVASAETGTGKTAAFVLPILERLIALRDQAPDQVSRTRVLILTPTRELAVQIEDDVQGFGYHAGIASIAVYGGAPMEPQSRALAAGVPIIVATPGRLLDHMRTATALFTNLEILVLDEADRMLDMGFWPDVRRIVDALPVARQTLLFSATMPDEVIGFAKSIMRDPAFVQVGQRNAAARTITHTIELVPTGGKTEWLVRFLRDEPGPVLVFVKTKIGADRLASRLAARRLRVAALHADRTQRDRMLAVEGFKSGRYQVLVATDIAARGLDIDGITHVVNYDLPHSPEDYVHRAGRTGRALATGTAVMLVSPDDERAARVITAGVESRRPSHHAS